MDYGQQENAWNDMTAAPDQPQDQFGQSQSSPQIGGGNLMKFIVAGGALLVAVLAVVFISVSNPFDKMEDKLAGSGSQDSGGAGTGTGSNSDKPGDGGGNSGGSSSGGNNNEITDDQLPALDMSKAYNSAKIIEADGNNGYIGDHVMGNKDAKVVVIEYGDLQCPSCAQATPKMRTLMEKYSDRVAFVFRNFPLESIHEYARKAASAAEAAGLQGKYWDMLENLYDSRGAWIDAANDTKRDKIFTNLFSETSTRVDTKKFQSAMTSERVKRKIDFDYRIGSTYDKVKSTPSFIVNGQMVSLSGVKDIKEAVSRVETSIKNALGN